MFFSLNLEQPYKIHAVVFSTSHSQHYFILKGLTIHYVAVNTVTKKITLCSVRTESLQRLERWLSQQKLGSKPKTYQELEVHKLCKRVKLLSQQN